MVNLPVNLLSTLIELGFTNYEARTYLCLLKHSPATGYEISQQAHVPRSVVYSVLRRLEAKGVVLAVHEKPHRYLPLPPQQLLSRLQSEFRHRLNVLRESFSNFDSKPQTESIWNIRGYDSLISTCEMLIREAQHAVYISGWLREIRQLQAALENAKTRGLDIVIFSFNHIDQHLGEVFCYGVAEEELEQHWDHKLILITDNTNLVMGPANVREDEQAIWTQNRAVLTIALNYIILDITLYGQRTQTDISAVVSRLKAEHFPEVDYLVAAALEKRKHSTG